MTKTDAKQIELLRAAGPEARSRLAASLTDTIVAMSRRGIDNARPDLDVERRELTFIEVVYGPALALRVEAYKRSR